MPSRLSDTPCKVSYCLGLRLSTYPPLFSASVHSAMLRQGARASESVLLERPLTAHFNVSYQRSLCQSPGFPRNVPSTLRRCQALSTRRIRTIPSWACPATSGSVFWLDRHSRARDGNIRETGTRVAQPVPSRPNPSVFYFTPRVNSEGAAEDPPATEKCTTPVGDSRCKRDEIRPNYKRVDPR